MLEAGVSWRLEAVLTVCGSEAPVGPERQQTLGALDMAFAGGPVQCSPTVPGCTASMRGRMGRGRERTAAGHLPVDVHAAHQPEVEDNLCVTVLARRHQQREPCSPLARSADRSSLRRVAHAPLFFAVSANTPHSSMK